MTSTTQQEPTSERDGGDDATLAVGQGPGGGVRATVWLLEDSALQARVILESLGETYQIEHFLDGSTLLERLAEGPEPDVLVLDWHLPGLSGLEVCRFVREDRDELTLPILLLTAARIDLPALVQGLAAGANDYVTRPCPPAALQARIGTLVRIRQLHVRARQAEQERSEAHAELERSTARLKDEATWRERFIGVVGHDLRTPLAAMLMTAQRLERFAAMPVQVTSLAGNIVRSGKRMERMIGDLLEYSRSRAGGGLPIAVGPMDFTAVCRAACEEIDVAYGGRPLEFTADGPHPGLWDADRVVQVVSNLLSNAIAYSPEGSPIRVRVEGSAEGSAQGVTLEVTNQGEPISPALLPELFDAFQRGDSALTGRTPGGLGLGLFIVRAIVQAHGGTVTVESTAERGTTFRVFFPQTG